jgi:hypothetical protein
MRPRHEHWHAVVRFDEYLKADPELAYSIVRVMRSAEDAVSEAARLNALNASRESHYFVQLARLDPGEADPDQP